MVLITPSRVKLSTYVKNTDLYSVIINLNRVNKMDEIGHILAKNKPSWTHTKNGLNWTKKVFKLFNNNNNNILILSIRTKQ